MSVFGVRKEFLDVYTPKTSISASAVPVSLSFREQILSFENNTQL